MSIAIPKSILKAGLIPCVPQGDRQGQLPAFSSILQNQSQGFDHLHPSDPAAAEPKIKSKVFDLPDCILLGIITEQSPTVSSLLIKHPLYGKDCARIIHSGINKHKPFTRITPGSMVYLNPVTLEIIWTGRNRSHVRCEPIGSKSDKTDPLSEQLARSVEPHMGKPYKKIDCYKLVVQGMKDIGLRYQGSGGLREHLVGLAKKQGLPENAYLTGEGLIQALGAEVYSRSIAKVREPEAQAKRVIQEMEPLLKRGYVLSFSTRTRGHTGIISRHQGQWTFINSGNLDHQVRASRQAKGVGEETLREEIRNWLELAAAKKERLYITLGRLEERKWMAFSQPGAQIEKVA